MVILFSIFHWVLNSMLLDDLLLHLVIIPFEFGVCSYLIYFCLLFFSFSFIFFKDFKWTNPFNPSTWGGWVGLAISWPTKKVSRLSWIFFFLSTYGGSMRISQVDSLLHIYSEHILPHWNFVSRNILLFLVGDQEINHGFLIVILSRL